MLPSWSTNLLSSSIARRLLKRTFSNGYLCEMWPDTFVFRLCREMVELREQGLYLQPSYKWNVHFYSCNVWEFFPVRHERKGNNKCWCSCFTPKQGSKQVLKPCTSLLVTASQAWDMSVQFLPATILHPSQRLLKNRTYLCKVHNFWFR